MRILLHRADGDTGPWIKDFSKFMPEAEVAVWRADEKKRPCDYAVVWSPPEEMLAELNDVKAAFITGAGVDGLLKFGDKLPRHVPIIRLDDAGMAVQMAEYVTHAVLRYFRRFDEYEAQARAGKWQALALPRKEDFSIGVLGMGVLGSRVLAALAPFGFPLRGWSRGEKNMPGVQCFHGADGLDTFLRGSQVLVCMLPLTPQTSNLMDRSNMSKLPAGAFLINVARGAHVAEPDLLTLIKSGHIAAATLDVFRNEPLPAQHPFWQEPRITITPHIAALTLRRESVQQICEKIRKIEAGAMLEMVDGMVDRNRGY